MQTLAKAIRVCSVVLLIVALLLAFSSWLVRELFAMTCPMCRCRVPSPPPCFSRFFFLRPHLPLDSSFFGGTQVPKVLTEALDNAGMGVEDVDWLLLHQVNQPRGRAGCACVIVLGSLGNSQHRCVLCCFCVGRTIRCAQGMTFASLSCEGCLGAREGADTGEKNK